MYFLKSRIKDSVKSLLSPNYIQSVPFKNVLNRYGTDKIKNFVQIGSNDGVKNDPLREFILKYKWPGILVEPNAANFKKLTENYSGESTLIFENVGIAEKSATLKFNFIDNIKQEEPDLYDQVGSFDESTFIKNISGNPELLNRHRTVDVPVITFEELLKKNQFHNVDLIHVDAEGYDFKILKSVDFKKYSPKVVLFESEWLTAFELRELINMFRTGNYLIFRDNFDHIAVKKEI